MTADEDAVAVPRHFVARKFEADEHALGIRLAPDERCLAAKIVFLRLERHGEADPGLEGVRLIVELAIRKDQPGLDPKDIEGFQSERTKPVRLACRPHCIPHGLAIVRVTENLEAQLTGVART